MKRVLWLSAAFLVFVGIFNMLCFLFTEEYTDSFYISIAFGNGSILFYALATLLMHRRKRYAYLDVQNAFIICSYFIICVILNFIFIMAKMQNKLANWVTNTILLGIYLIALFIIFAANATSEKVLETDRREQEAFYDIKEKAELLLNRGNSFSLNKKLEFVYDRVSSCQINRTANVAESDRKICEEIDGILLDLVSEEYVEAEQKIMNVLSLLDDRDRIIKKALRR